MKTKQKPPIGLLIIFIVLVIFLIGGLIQLAFDGVPKEAKRLLTNNGAKEIVLISKNDVRFIVNSDDVMYNGIMDKGKLIALYVGEGYGGNFPIYDIREGDNKISSEEKKVISRIRNFRKEYLNSMLQVPQNIIEHIPKIVTNKNYFIGKAQVFDCGNYYILNIPVSFTLKNGLKKTKTLKYKYDATTDQTTLIEAI